MINRENKTPIVVIWIWPEPAPKPAAIIRNKKTSSSGSLIAALNLTIDNAPTNPSDNAKDDLTMVITMVVVIPKITKFLENSNLFDSVEEYFK